MAYENILVEREGAVAIVTINRPKVLNALNTATVTEIEAVFDELDHDASVRAIIVTGAGERSFVAGADINELLAMTGAAEARAYTGRGQVILTKIEQLSKPVVAAINGYALGGGLEIALACDIRIAADTARLGIPEINLALIPGYGGTQRLPRLVGKGMAKLMALTGDHVTADEAYRIGLVERVVPAADVRSAALALAQKLAEKAPVAVKMIKDAINQGVEADLIRGLAIESQAMAICFATEDRVEGTSAFLEKRKPQWQGR
ncbi:MAG: enoyl-CoA hydratase/isomerase family protein [Chloroflexi bacterium]|nr:enoyl-CoA hydratase/isomerase family protein [Chloroflexota bacterium]